MDPWDRDCWVFDMDGTLTVAMHDFEGFKAANGLPPGRPILEELAAMPQAQAQLVLDALDAWEVGLARSARAAPGAQALLSRLQQQGHKLGVLTRNTRPNALLTLAAAGLSQFFDPSDVLGREDATPKPSPDGIHQLLERWGDHPDNAVMVGDYGFDIQAGRSAGTATVFVASGPHTAQNPPLDGIADIVIYNLRDLLR